MPRRISGLTEIRDHEKCDVLAECERIFFATAKTQIFPSEKLEGDYRERWFGQYVRQHSEAFFVVFEEDEVAGYLAGCYESFASYESVLPPSKRESWGSVVGDLKRALAHNLDYYDSELMAVLAGFPAHFHSNIAPKFQRRGHGRALIRHFVLKCQERSLPGIHVVTGAKSSAAEFYRACAFRDLPWPALPYLAVLVRDCF